MTTDAAVAWLRKQIEGDLSAATIISDGGIAPQRWTTDPPGQVNPAAHPADRAITGLLGEHDPELRAYWTPVIAWDHEIGETEADDGQVGSLPAMLVSNGRREVDHACRHDPRNVVADCEAKLAMLGLHGPEDTFGPDDVCCTTCGDVPQVPWPCPTLHLLAPAYRHRDGYAEHWGETVSA